MSHFFAQKHYISLRLENGMANQADQINLDKIIFDENNSEKKSWICIGHSCSRSLIIFVPSFCHLVSYSGQENTLIKIVRREYSLGGNFV